MCKGLWRQPEWEPKLLYSETSGHLGRGHDSAGKAKEGEGYVRTKAVGQELAHVSVDLCGRWDLKHTVEGI